MTKIEMNEMEKLLQYLNDHGYKTKCFTGLNNWIGVYDDKDNRLWRATLNTEWDFGVPDEFYGTLEVNGFINGEGVNLREMTADDVIELLEGTGSRDGTVQLTHYSRIVVLCVGTAACEEAMDRLDPDCMDPGMPALSPANNINLYYIDTDSRGAAFGLLIGKELTRGKGAKGKPSLGEGAARESEEDIRHVLTGADMVIIFSEMGGGTAIGASPVIAEISKEMGIPTFAVVTEPDSDEGPKRLERAREGIEHLSGIVDGITVIPSDYGIDEDGYFEDDDIIFKKIQKVINAHI